jgi:hypothetical protein
VRNTLAYDQRRFCMTSTLFVNFVYLGFKAKCLDSKLLTKTFQQSKFNAKNMKEWFDIKSCDANKMREKGRGEKDRWIEREKDGGIEIERKTEG